MSGLLVPEITGVSWMHSMFQHTCNEFHVEPLSVCNTGILCSPAVLLQNVSWEAEYIALIPATRVEMVVTDI